MNIVGVGNSIRLTAAVKRIYLDWHTHVNSYHGLPVHSQAIEEALGGRLTPGIVKVAATRPVELQDDAGSGVDHEVDE